MMWSGDPFAEGKASLPSERGTDPQQYAQIAPCTSFQKCPLTIIR